MTSGAVSVIDASVIVLFTEQEPDVANDQEHHRRWLNTRECVNRLMAQGAAFVVPAPVMTELEIGGDAQHKIAQALAAKQNRLWIEAFDHSAAPVAGKMLRNAHRAMVQQSPGPGRRATVKFDAMIAATAHVMGAKYLVTANARDFEQLLAEVNSAVEVLDTTVLAGQQVLAMPSRA